MNLDLANAIANDPRVRQFRKAVQIMNSSLVSKYGRDFAEPTVLDSFGISTDIGKSRWTPRDEELYNSLMRGYILTRKTAMHRLTTNI